MLHERGYVTRDTDPLDGRRKRLSVTPLGHEVLRQGESVFDELRAPWEQRIGTDELASLETHLTALVGARPVRLDAPGWIAKGLGEPAR
ncbi:hypothetical protein SUDANB145_03568 [Streptomyces sp. enrichment culture]